MKVSILFPLTCIAVLLFLGWKAQPWSFSAKLFPLCLVGLGVFLLSVQVLRELWGGVASAESQGDQQSMDVGMMGDGDPSVLRWRGVEIWAWLLGFLLAILIIGMLISLPLFSFLYLKVHARERWWISILIPLLVGSFMYGLFEVVLHTPWVEGWLWELLLPGRLG